MARKGKATVDLSDSDSDDGYSWKPDWQKEDEKKAAKNNSIVNDKKINNKTNNNKLTNRKTTTKSSRIVKKPTSRGGSDADNDDDDDDDGPITSSPPSSRIASSSTSGFDDEKDEDDEDRDEWRVQNRQITDKQSKDSKYQSQLTKWTKFRAEFPFPYKQPLVSAGAVLALRKQLKQRKKLVFEGIPIHLRRDVWELLSGARAFPEKYEYQNSENRYRSYLQRQPSSIILKQIHSDVPRALKGHLKFTTKQGQLELTHVLTAFAERSKKIGYANGMCHVAAFLLLFYPEERAFWMLCTLVDIILPNDYYTNSLLGVRADAQLVKILVFQRLSRLHSHFLKFNIDISVIVLKWLMPLYLITLPMHVCIRIFDILMLEGSNFLISIALALLFLHMKKILTLTDEADILLYFEKIGSEEKSIDSDTLINFALSNKCLITEDELKRREVERRIMESAYMKDLQLTQKFRRQEEEKKAEELKKQVEIEEANLGFGVIMWKIGKQGKPRQTKIYLRNETPTQEDIEKRIYTMTWDSQKKSFNESRLLLRDCCLVIGMKAGNFQTRKDVLKPFINQTDQAFSIISPIRSLDLICSTKWDFEEWMKVLMRVPMKEKESIRIKKNRGEGNEDDGHGEEEEEEEEKVAAILTSSSSSGIHSNGSSGIAGSTAINSGSSAVVGSSSNHRKTLAELRAERAAANAGAANNKLAALFKSVPAASASAKSETDSDSDSPPVTKKKK